NFNERNVLGGNVVFIQVVLKKNMQQAAQRGHADLFAFVICGAVQLEVLCRHNAGTGAAFDGEHADAIDCDQVDAVVHRLDQVGRGQRGNVHGFGHQAGRGQRRNGNGLQCDVKAVLGKDSCVIGEISGDIVA